MSTDHNYLLVVKFFHGRTDPGVRMDKWGSEGPAIVCRDAHMTYGATLCLGGIAPESRAALGPQYEAPFDHAWITFHDGCALVDGVYYGDVWVSIRATPDEDEGDREQSLTLLAKTLDALAELAARFGESADLSSAEGDDEDAREMLERRDDVRSLSDAVATEWRRLLGG